MAAQLETVTAGGSRRESSALSGFVFVEMRRNVRLPDGVLALLVACLVVADVVRPGEPVDISAAALVAVGALCLAWRRNSPMTVLLISAACFCLYQSQQYPHAALPVAVLIALYTVAASRGALIAAIATGTLVVSVVGADVGQLGWPGVDLDDRLVAYVLSAGGACALGYAVQLCRARNQLLREQAALLTAEHVAREQQALQQEQVRIARELHDVIAHQVSVITALASGAQRVIGTDPAMAGQTLNSIEVAGREALTEMRRLLRVLRADSGSDRGGVGLVPHPSLERLPALVAHTEAAGLPVQLSVHGQPRPLPAGIELCAYRITQEALTNTLKHAGPSRATVRLNYQPSSLELHVFDDGRGMPRDPTPGNGLIGMHERAALVGGRLLVGVGPAGGVQVSVWLPTEADV